MCDPPLLHLGTLPMKAVGSVKENRENTEGDKDKGKKRSLRKWGWELRSSSPNPSLTLFFHF